MVAVHHYHIAIEITLRNIVSKYSISNYKDNCGFSDLIGIIKNSTVFKNTDLKLPHEHKIKTVNTRRNDIQHNFVEPSNDLTNQTGLDTYRFFSDTFENLFGVDFNELTESSLIESEFLRKYIQYAERHFVRGDFYNSYRCSTAAFEWARMYLKKQKQGNETLDIFSDLRSIEENDNFPEDAIELLERVGNQLNKNTEQLSLLSSGIDMSEYSYFKEFKPYVSLIRKGNVHFGSNRKQPTEISTRSAINYVTRTILVWQIGADSDIFNDYQDGSQIFFNLQDSLIEDSS